MIRWSCETTIHHLRSQPECIVFSGARSSALGNECIGEFLQSRIRAGGATQTTSDTHREGRRRMWRCAGVAEGCNGVANDWARQGATWLAGWHRLRCQFSQLFSDCSPGSSTIQRCTVASTLSGARFVKLSVSEFLAGQFQEYGRFQPVS